MNGLFEPTYSTNHIWVDEEFDQCLTLHLESMQTSIDGKANTSHTHTGYADATHTHSEYAPLTHEHTGYATSEHTHAGYAESNHTHTEYASAIHSHSEYAPSEHIHSGYALENHEHTGYALTSHSHNEYAGVNHTHTDYASSTHTHSYNDLTDKPTIPSTDGLATTAYVDSAVAGISSITVDDALSATSTNPVQNKIVYEGLNLLSTGLANHTHGDLYYTESEINTLLNAKANANHVHNVFSSITEIGITTFPTTMQTVANAMPKNSMIIMDTRRVNGTNEEYGTEIISDWGNTANGIALICKGHTTARITMMIMYGTSESDHGDLTMGSYAITDNRVNWTAMDDLFDEKVDKISKLSAVDLNTITETGLYYVSSGTEALHYPAGSNGHMLVMSDGTRVRQVYFRVGTVDTNNFQWYSRHLGSDTTVGDNGWSQWWLLSGSEKAWSGTSSLNTEINLGSRYGCQSWTVVARLTSTGTLTSITIPRFFLTTDTTQYRWQIADETAFINFYFYYKESDDNVYIKVVDYTDNDYANIRYVYRVS